MQVAVATASGTAKGLAKLDEEGAFAPLQSRLAKFGYDENVVDCQRLSFVAVL